ncbi:hypothetical protein AGMMS49525_00360 [Bacteroidia bacterium]|nr:hypothetical protein AGMMS49525_00360 [Bacteroidia bacterium]
MNEEDKKYYKQLALDYRNAAKLRNCFAAVHVEAADDKIFWSKVFEHYLPQYSFHYITYSRTPKGETAVGCTACLKYHEGGCLSKDFFICIDSDYRYLLREKDIDIEHFVFQTYTYSIENHYCYHECIESLFVKLGLNNNLFKVKDFLDALSKSLYRPFMYHLLSIKKADGLFLNADFENLINVSIQTLNPSQIISELKKCIDSKIKLLKKEYDKSEIQTIESEYSKLKLGLTSKNTYLYCRGHNMFSLIIKLAKKIHKELEKEKIQSYTPNQKTDYFSQPRNPIEDYLKEDVYFDKYSEIDKIKTDTKIYEQL